MWNSNYYMENYNSNYNANSEFYDSRTFGIDIYEDACTPITDNVVFKNFVNDALTCIGKWCIDNTFNCIHRDTQNCYNVEHIIDTKGQEFTDAKCKQISGNLVMAYGKWNSQLGSRAGIKNGSYYYESINEKELIYGKDRVDSVRSLIIRCNPYCGRYLTNSPTVNTNLDEQPELFDITINKIWLFDCIMLGLVFTLILGTLIYMLVKLCKKCGLCSGAEVSRYQDQSQSQSQSQRQLDRIYNNL